MIDWFNHTNGFVLSILTAVYVVASLAVLCFMARSNRLAERAIEHSQRLHHQQTRPYVVFDLVPRDRSIYAELQNYGVMPAFDVAVTLDQELKSIGNRQSTLLRNPVGMLAPNRVITDFIDVGHQFHESNVLVFTGTVTYRDGNGAKYSEQFSLDLKYYKEKLEPDKRDIGRELEKVKEELQKISNALAARS